MSNSLASFFSRLQVHRTPSSRKFLLSVFFAFFLPLECFFVQFINFTLPLYVSILVPFISAILLSTGKQFEKKTTLF